MTASFSAASQPLWGRLANLRPIGKSACFVGQPILAAAGFQPARGARTPACFPTEVIP
jgi:hypothetical protein